MISVVITINRSVPDTTRYDETQGHQHDDGADTGAAEREYQQQPQYCVKVQQVSRPEYCAADERKIRMPGNANPRIMSSVAMRSLIGSEPIDGIAIGFPLLAAEPLC